MKRAFVAGWPIAHSRSPLIHACWLERYGILGSYEKVAVPPQEFGEFLAGMRAGAFVGGNVTIPHKETAAVHCDRLTAAAERLEAANTLWMEGGELWGDSSDGAGFLGALDQEALGWDARKARASVIGAGGAARAIVEALIGRGFAEVVVANRTFERARLLTERLGGKPVSLAALPDLLAGSDLLVNTTSAGMQGQPPLELELSALPTHATVDDIVYVPHETPLLRTAADRGLRTVGGLGMLLHQAVPGFARWFGVVPTVTSDLRALIENDIATASRGGS